LFDLIRRPQVAGLNRRSSRPPAGQQTAPGTVVAQVKGSARPRRLTRAFPLRSLAALARLPLRGHPLRAAEAALRRCRERL